MSPKVTILLEYTNFQGFCASNFLQMDSHKFCVGFLSSIFIIMNCIWHIHASPDTVNVPTSLTRIPLSIVKIHWYDDWLSVLSTGPTLNTLLFGLTRSGIHSSPSLVSPVMSNQLITSLLTTTPLLFLLMINQSSLAILGSAPTNPHVQLASWLVHTVVSCGPLVIVRATNVHYKKCIISNFTHGI